MMKGDILWKKSKMMMKGIFLGKQPIMKKSPLGKKPKKEKNLPEVWY
jgi:hypothetical protein